MWKKRYGPHAKKFTLERNERNKWSRVIRLEKKRRFAEGNTDLSDLALSEEEKARRSKKMSEAMLAAFRRRKKRQGRLL